MTTINYKYHDSNVRFLLANQICIISYKMCCYNIKLVQKVSAYSNYLLPTSNYIKSFIISKANQHVFMVETYKCHHYKL